MADKTMGPDLVTACCPRFHHGNVMMVRLTRPVIDLRKLHHCVPTLMCFISGVKVTMCCLEHLEFLTIVFGGVMMMVLFGR